MSARIAGVLMASVLAAGLAPGGPVHAQQDAPPKFKAGVAVVPISVVVRDSRGAIVRNLTRDDFQVLEDGQPRAIVDFRPTAEAPISVALLLDTSGSMRDANHTRAAAAIDALLQSMNRTGDEAALFTFDRTLREETPFTSDPSVIRSAVAKTFNWGQTSLYDAVGETAKRLSERPSERRAVIVITDGADNSSRRSADEVSGAASSVDVPVYVVAVAPRRRFFGGGSDLADLARSTGGTRLNASTSEELQQSIATLLAELRQQYFLAIDSSTVPGWHKLEVRTRGGNNTVRARSGYTTSTRTDG
jgi:Ca-activated chloride channel family protein